MDCPLEVDNTILTTDDPKSLPPSAIASGSPSLTCRLTLGSRPPTWTETVSPPERTTCTNPVGKMKGDWLPDIVSDAEVDPKGGGVADSRASIMLGEGLAICTDGMLDREILPLVNALMLGEISVSALEVPVASGVISALMEVEEASLETEAGVPVVVSEGIPWGLNEEDNEIVTL
jgi:hypothetical protein